MSYIKKEPYPISVQGHEHARQTLSSSVSVPILGSLEHVSRHAPSPVDGRALVSSDRNTSTPSVKTEPVVLQLPRNESLSRSATPNEKTESLIVEPVPLSEAKKEDLFPQAPAPQQVTPEPVLSQPTKPQGITKESKFSRSSSSLKAKKKRGLPDASDPRKKKTKKKTRKKNKKAHPQVSASSVKKEQLLPQTSAQVETELPSQRSTSQSENKDNKVYPVQFPKKEQALSHFSNAQESRDEHIHQGLSSPSHVKKEDLLSTSEPHNAACKILTKRKRTISVPKQPVKTTTKEEPTVRNAPAPCDASSKRSLTLSPPRKRARLQPTQSQEPSRPPLPKTENTTSDEVIIVFEKIVNKPSQQASKNTQLQPVPNVSGRRVEEDTVTPSRAPVVTPQTEAEKTLLIEDYALYVVERDEETKAITWVVCKFCPIYGCQRRQRPYIMAYHVPLAREELDRHVQREHLKIWTLFKNASREQKQAIFYRKRMPLNHVLQRRIAELKLSWGMKNRFTDVQQTAWRERKKIAQRWKKSSQARKRVAVETLADGLGINLSTLKNASSRTAKRKESHMSGAQDANGQIPKDEAQNNARQRRIELRKEAQRLEVEMNDRGSDNYAMSVSALKAAVERRKRYERRVTQPGDAT